MINKWSEVSINLFKKMRNVPQDDDYTFNLIALLTGKSLDEILEQPLAVTSYESSQLEFICHEPKTGIVKLKYKLGNTVYKPQFDITNLTTAQYIDFQCLGKDSDMLETLACVLVPEGMKYNTGYSKEEAMKEIGEYMSIEDALSVCSFFTKWSELLLHRMAKKFKRMFRKSIRKAPTKELRKQMKGVYKGLSSLGWERLIVSLSSQESVGKESTNTR